MKKTLLKILLASLGVLALTILSPETADTVATALAQGFDRIFHGLETGVRRVLPEVHITREMIVAIPVWVFLILLGVAGINRISRKKEPEKEECFVKPDAEKEDRHPSPAAEAPPGGEYNRDVVVRFFLNIFKIQLGAMKSAPAKFQVIGSINVWPNRVYELSVFHEGDWVSRRMTIGPLGDDGVSKSICYYVIFDDHLVVKIPPEPITDFQEYLSCIKADMRIARRLSPKECIIPRVSVILGRLVSQQAKTKAPDPKTMEKGYVERLTANSQLQENLKIQGSFVFFMDLSRYYFLSSVLTEMHDMDNAMPREILGQPQIIWDTYEFEGRYGRHNAHIGFEMRNIYDEYEREINRLLIQYGVSTSLPTYTMKGWFLTHLSGRGRIESAGELSQAFIEDLNALSRESMIDNRVSIESYRRVVREYIYTSTIARFKAEMGSIVTNLIGLLIWLGRKQVAMRDLKPDNLLIAGDLDKYPLFLRSPDQFSIGFIDVETAVDFGKESTEEIMQPQLGGTPKYATPSHLFPNELIVAVYGDLKRILHLQDWYATVAMIFKVVTGGTLFEKTAMLLPEIKRIMETPISDGEHLASITEHVSRMFWKSAVDEFHEKIDKNRRILNHVLVIVLEKDKAVILSRMVDAQKVLARGMIRKINGQALFTSRKNKESLLSSSAARIASMRKKCETDHGDRLSRKADIVRFLRELETMKTAYEQRCAALDLMKSSRTEIPVATIMEVMFNVVLTTMYTEIWGEFSEETETAGADGETDASYEATI
ncbi:hypothetical protein JCM14469_31200 [Desulfatiferula olefinivorans]